MNTLSPLWRPEPRGINGHHRGAPDCPERLAPVQSRWSSGVGGEEGTTSCAGGFVRCFIDEVNAGSVEGVQDCLSDGAGVLWGARGAFELTENSHGVVALVVTELGVGAGDEGDLRWCVRERSGDGAAEQAAQLCPDGRGGRVISGRGCRG